jgi:hypothetical protein
MAGKIQDQAYRQKNQSQDNESLGHSIFGKLLEYFDETRRLSCHMFFEGGTQREN